MKIRNAIIAAGLVLGSSATTIAVAQASSSTYSTSNRVETVYNGKCIHTYTRTVRDMSWSSKAGRYVLLVKPSVTVSNTYRCHA